ncbi:MAG: hypothetical protein M1821_003492 [Bathelium mastoideum]|nr:MAG: hypothetical protein M1821_003492 [Bathelium mastoideum]
MSSPTKTISTVTTIFEVLDSGNGKYEINEIKSDEAVFPDLHSGNRKEIDIKLPAGLAIVGYYDIDDEEIGAYMTFWGTQLGNKFGASVDNGVKISSERGFVKGNIHIFKADGQLKASYHLTIKVGIFLEEEKSDEIVLFNI